MEVVEPYGDPAAGLIRVRASSDRRAPADGPAPDPVTTQVIRHGLNAVAAQMAVVLRRTAFSPVIYEVNDFACALFDRDVRLLAQAQVFPLFLGTMSFCVEACVKAVGGEEALRPGDVLFSSYAYDIGSHSQDAAVVVPGFVDGQLVSYAAVKAHHLDIGAKEPYCTDTTDLFQEGVILPGVKLMREGAFDDDLYRTLLANSRMPKALAGDLNAEIIAARHGLTGLHRLRDKYGHDVFGACVERMFDHAEAGVRAFFAGIPDGRFVGRGSLDNDGLSDDLVPIDIAVEIERDQIVVDFTDCAPAQRGPVNCPLASSVSAARMAVMALAGGVEMINEGHIRAIEVRLKRGTMFCPEPPTPLFLYFWTAMQAVDVIHRAMGEAMPDVVGAGSGGDIDCVVWWGHRPDGEIWGASFGYFTGQGAGPGRDGGTPLFHVAASGMRNPPVEVWEARFPMVVDRLEMIPDSGGAGEWAGGPGVEVRYRALDECSFTSTVERTKDPAWSLAGGRPGLANTARLIAPDGTATECAKRTGVVLAPGATLQLVAGGGAGYGPPERRDPERVRRDVDDGYLTEDGARRLYPHALTPAVPTTEREDT